MSELIEDNIIQRPFWASESCTADCFSQRASADLFSSNQFAVKRDPYDSRLCLWRVVTGLLGLVPA